MEKQDDICRDWAQLPVDLLIHIAKRLECVEQMSAFSAVCSSWRAASNTVKPNWTPAIPCLLYPVNTENEPSCDWSLLDLSTNKHCKLELPDSWEWRYQDCGDGWIITEIYPSMDVLLFNPLANAQISLPPLPKESYTFGYHTKKEMARVNCIRRAIVVKIPPNDELLILVVYDLTWLAYAKPGGDSWRCTEIPFGTHPSLRNCLEDVIIFKGQILILCGDGTLMGTSLDLFLRDQEYIAFDVYLAGDIHGDISIYAEDSLEDFHLVESCGDILVIVRHTTSFENKNHLEDEEEEEFDLCKFMGSDFVTKWFEVFKFDSEAKAWVKVDDLGDVSLFVGNHSAVSGSASNAINCKPNCIYFTDDNLFPVTQLCLVGIYDMESGEIEELCVKEEERSIFSRYRVPFWFMPKFM